MQSTGPGRTSGEEDSEALNRSPDKNRLPFTAPHPGSWAHVAVYRTGRCTDLSDQKSLQEGASEQTPEGGGTEASVVVEELSVLSLKKKVFKIFKLRYS